MEKKYKVIFDYKMPERAPWRITSEDVKIKPICNWGFDSPEFAELAAALWAATPEEEREINHFQHTFKNVLKMIGAETLWSH